MRARNYMQQIAGGTGNVLTHHKTIEDFQRYFGDHSSKPEVQEFMRKITSDKEGWVASLELNASENQVKKKSQLR